jgi:hypothetical protein
MGDFSQVPEHKLADRFKMLTSTTKFVCILSDDQVHTVEDIATPDNRYIHSDGAGTFGSDIAEQLLDVLGEATSAVQVKLTLTPIPTNEVHR